MPLNMQKVKACMYIKDIDKTPFIEAVQPIHANFYNKRAKHIRSYMMTFRNMQINAYKPMVLQEERRKSMKYLNKVVEIILEVLVAGMVLGCCWQVITRFVLHNPSKYTEELLRYMLIWLTMMGVPYAYGQNSHLAINLIVKKFKPKNETLAQIAIDVLIMILSVSVMIIWWNYGYC